MASKPDPYAGKLIRIAQGRSNSLGKAKNRNMTWAEFRKELSKPQRTQERFSAFLKLPKVEQDKLKSINGWILGGEISGDRRRKNQIENRFLITLDCDEMTPEVFATIRDGSNPICLYEFFAHTTRKHTPEAPRLRIFLLPTDPVLPEEYPAVSAILAEKVDPSMDSVDHVSFRLAQMMFRPSVSADGVFVAWHNRGELVDTKAELEGFRLDWTDYRNLPHSEARGPSRTTASKADDPTQKHGIVGAFCRAFDVEEAIAKFLPDVYLPGDDGGGKPRYSYAEGSTSNGVVVEDDGLFIYSFHGTDPCGERLCNAFDMVRIHLFEEKDKDLPENTNPKDWPSYKAMVKWAEDLDPVKTELLADKLDLDAMFDDISGEFDDPSDDIDAEIADLLAPPPNAALPEILKLDRFEKPSKDWPQKLLDLNLDGTIKITTTNVAHIFTHDPRLFGAIALNTFSNKPVARRSIRSKVKVVPPIIVRDPVNGDDWTDTHDVTLKAMMESAAGKGKMGYGLRVSRADVKDGVLLAARCNVFHPVVEYYQSLVWDQVERIETMFIRHFGCPDTPYHREISRLFMLAAVTRVMNPGHKWDYAPIISGPQGIRKSSWIVALFGSWAGELTTQMTTSKDSVEQMMGKQCLELPELAGVNRSQVEDVKAFMTHTTDQVRLAYDTRMSHFKRQCVFVGTTNSDAYLKDATGNRRFWPVTTTVDMIDTDMVAAEKDQLWAEAFALWRAEAIKVGHYSRIVLTLSRAATLEAEGHQDRAREEDGADANAAVIEAWLDRPIPLSQFLGSNGVVDDLENFEGEPMVLRCATTTKWAAVEALEMSINEGATKFIGVGRSMSRITGWARSGFKRRHPVFGNGHTYYREDATAEEIELGYRIVGQAGGGGDPENTDDPEDDIL